MAILKPIPVSYIETGTNAVYRNLKKFFESRNEVMPGDAVTINNRLRESWNEEYSTMAIGKEASADQRYEVYVNQIILPDLYEHIWSACSTREKLLLLDIAREGLFNYKSERVTTKLYLKGLLMYDDDKEHLKIMSASFRNYIIVQGESRSTADLEREARKSSSWKNFQTPVLVLIICIGVFFFVTQENLMNRAGALIPTLTGAVSLLAALFGKKTEKTG